MAEDYRSKYLVLEQDHSVLKHTHELEIEKARQDHEKVVVQLQERI